MIHSKHTDYRGNKRHAAQSPRINAEQIVERSPINGLCMKLLEEQQRECAGIANKVNRYDKEAHIAFYPEAGYKSFKEYRLETEVGHVKAKALQK